MVEVHTWVFKLLNRAALLIWPGDLQRGCSFTRALLVNTLACSESKRPRKHLN